MIRTMLPDDAAALCRICHDALGHQTTEEHLAARIECLAKDDAYFLAVCEDDADHEVVGFIQAQRYDLVYGESGWNIIALAVEKTARGRGHGRSLVEALETLARSRGDRFVRLNSRMERPEAHAFYEHLGYRCDKVQKRFIRQL